MSPEEMKNRGSMFLEEVINGGNYDRAEEYFKSDYVDHAAPPGVPPGVEGLRLFFTMFRSAFPDLHYTIEDSVAEGNIVVQRATAEGTHQGEFQGMPATGKHAKWQEIHMSRMEGDKFVEHWAAIDQMGMLQQLGVIPTPGQ